MDMLKRSKGAMTMPEVRDNRIEELTSSIPGVVYQFVVDADNSWRFTFVSRGVEELFGVTQAAVCRDANVMTRRIVEEDREAYREEVRIATNTLQPRFSEYRILTADGQPKWVRGRAQPVKQPDGSVVWSGILTDITEHKDLEAACRKAQETAGIAETIISSQQQLRTLIEAMPDIVFFKDGHGLWLITNQASIAMFGLQNVSWEGKSDRDLMSLCPEYAKTFEICIESDEYAWNSGRTFHTEELIFSHNHPRRVFNVTKVPLFNADGSRKGIVVIGRDISEQKQMEVKLWNNTLHTEKMIERERASVARDLHDDLGQTLTALSFEVKKVQNLVSHTVPSAMENIGKMFEFIDSMTTSIHRIRTTLKPLLLNELGLVASIELLAEQLSSKSGIRINFDSACHICDCVEDSIHVFKIVNEALNNCLEHSQATEISIACVTHAGECLLDISDNGIGFMYPNASRTNSFGLVGMRERADLLGARLDIRSVVGKGTVVRLSLPCNRKEEAADAISHN